MSITGKFMLERNENFHEHLIALGIPEERARAVDRLKPVLDITLEGNNIKFSSYSGEFQHVSVLVLDQIVDETIAIQFNIKSIARKIDDHTLEIESTGTVAERGIRRYEFSDKSLIMTIENDNETVPVAKRIYRRL